jgi:hypothetical protein
MIVKKSQNRLENLQKSFPNPQAFQNYKMFPKNLSKFAENLKTSLEYF